MAIGAGKRLPVIHDTKIDTNGPDFCKLSRTYVNNEDYQKEEQHVSLNL
jgi:hypothetical protein